MTRGEQLAEAMLKIAEADHYMVGLVESVTDDEIHEAQQILIRQQNEVDSDNPNHAIYELALDLLEVMECKARNQ